MASPRGLSSQFSVWSCSNFQLGFCWNLRIWQQNLHTRAASPTCWDPALPQNNSWESSHKQHHFCTLPLGGGHQEKTPNSPSKQNSSISNHCLIGIGLKNLIFDFARVSFHLHFFFFSPLHSVKVELGSQLNITLLTWNKREILQLREFINSSTFTPKNSIEHQEPRIKMSHGESGPQKSSLPTNDWF